MKKQLLYIPLLTILSSTSISQEVKIDTITWDKDNIHFVNFSGTWYDNMYNYPVMRGFSLSRIRKDSSQFSLTFNIDGRITSQNFKDSLKILDSTNWWYDGSFNYMKELKDSLYSAKKIIKYDEGNIIIAYRNSGQFFSLAQTKEKLGVDCNPKLNNEEIKFLKERFTSDSFDFAKKNIGFATNKGSRPLGYANSFLPVCKKEYFNDIIRGLNEKTLASKLIVLNSLQKEETYGFDAIVLYYKNKYQKKADRSKFDRLITVFGYRQLNYPHNLDLVGKDTSEALSVSDADFFNELFKHKRKTFDFKEKKIAVVSTHANSVIPKKQFIEKVKQHLENDFLYPFDFLYVFNEKEKRESGGYDAAIIYDCKKCSGSDALQIIKWNKSNSNN